MSGIRIVRVQIGLEVQLPEDFLERQFGEICFVTPPNLALQVERYVRKEHLGYYPALDFFKDKDQVDPTLLSTALHLYSLVSDAVEQEISRRLRPAFSNVYCEAIQCHALSLPRARPPSSHPASARVTQEGVPIPNEALVAHYRPDHFRLDLDVASVVRNPPQADEQDRRQADANVEKQTRQKVLRWLRNHFESASILYSTSADG